MYAETVYAPAAALVDKNIRCCVLTVFGINLLAFVVPSGESIAFDVIVQFDFVQETSEKVFE
jgi:hypothetical protein